MQGRNGSREKRCSEENWEEDGRRISHVKNMSGHRGGHCYC